MTTRWDQEFREPHARLEQSVRDWIATKPAGTAELRVIAMDAPGGPGVEVVPTTAGAATIFLRLEAPTEMVLHLGRDSWWDRVPVDPALVHAICDGRQRGSVRETVRFCCGLVMTSHGELQLNEAA